MIEYEIVSFINAIKEASARLRLAQGQPQKDAAEDDLCMETRALFTRYVDRVLWTGEFDSNLDKRVRSAIASGVQAVRESQSGAAKSIRRRLEEFENFSKEEKKKSRKIPA